MRRSRGFAIAFAVLASPAVYADSDGYFCHSTEYLAYNLSAASGAPRHALRLVRLRPSQALDPSALITVPLPDFQLHGLRCLDGEVQLRGWDHLYRVQLSESAPPQVTSEPLPHPGFVPEAFASVETRNLGAWSLAARDDATESLDLSQHHRLRISAERTPPCTVHVTTTLLQRDGAGNVQSSLMLYDRSMERDCH